MRPIRATAALALLAACAGPSKYDNAELSGTVTYEEKIEYGPNAALVVYLVDVSGPESPLSVELQKLRNPVPGSELLASTSVEGLIRSPEDFTLPVPLDKVDGSHDYALKAVILDREAPVMATTNPPLVLTKGRPYRADLVVVPVAGP